MAARDRQFGPPCHTGDQWGPDGNPADRICQVDTVRGALAAGGHSHWHSQLLYCDVPAGLCLLVVAWRAGTTGASSMDARISRGALYPGDAAVLDHHLTLNPAQLPSSGRRSSRDYASAAHAIAAAA